MVSSLTCWRIVESLSTHMSLNAGSLRTHSHLPPVFLPPHRWSSHPNERFWQWSENAVSHRYWAPCPFSLSDLPADDRDWPGGPDRSSSEPLQCRQAGGLQRPCLTGFLCGQWDFHRHLGGCFLLCKVRDAWTLGSLTCAQLVGLPCGPVRLKELAWGRPLTLLIKMKFLNLGMIDILDRKTVHGRDCPVHWRMFRSILSLYPAVARRALLLLWLPNMSPDIVRCTLGWEALL